jgi:hypothetical protein
MLSAKWIGYLPAQVLELTVALVKNRTYTLAWTVCTIRDPCLLNYPTPHTGFIFHRLSYFSVWQRLTNYGRDWYMVGN